LGRGFSDLDQEGQKRNARPSAEVAGYQEALVEAPLLESPFGQGNRNEEMGVRGSHLPQGGKGQFPQGAFKGEVSPVFEAMDDLSEGPLVEAIR